MLRGTGCCYSCVRNGVAPAAYWQNTKTYVAVSQSLPASKLVRVPSVKRKLSGLTSQWTKQKERRLMHSPQVTVPCVNRYCRLMKNDMALTNDKIATDITNEILWS